MSPLKPDPVRALPWCAAGLLAGWGMGWLVLHAGPWIHLVLLAAFAVAVVWGLRRAA